MQQKTRIIQTNLISDGIANGFGKTMVPFPLKSLYYRYIIVILYQRISNILKSTLGALD